MNINTQIPNKWKQMEFSIHKEVITTWTIESRFKLQEKKLLNIWKPNMAIFYMNTLKKRKMHKRQF